MFAAQYTTYTVAPQEHPRGSAVPGYNVELTLALVHERDESGVAGPAVVGRQITEALNQHAGGRRQFGTTSVFVSWRINWTNLLVRSGRVLGVSILNDDVFEGLERPGHPAMAETFVYGPPNQEFGRIVFRASSFVPARTRRERAISQERNQSTFAHEVGHSLGLRDHRSDPSSTMFYRQLTNQHYRRLNQRWSDAELRLALQNVFSGPGRTPPPWLV